MVRTEVSFEYARCWEKLYPDSKPYEKLEGTLIDIPTGEIEDITETNLSAPPIHLLVGSLTSHAFTKS